MGFAAPVTDKVLAALPADKAAQLKTWSKNHSVIFDIRIHSIHTCPFLAYLPNYLAYHDNPAKFAPFLYEFFQWKHKEENHCTCGK